MKKIFVLLIIMLFTQYVMGQIGTAEIIDPDGYLNVRSSPCTRPDCAKIGKLNAGETVSIIGRYDDDWLIINYEGQKAYISAQKHRVNFTATGQSKNSNSVVGQIGTAEIIDPDGYLNVRSSPCTRPDCAKIGKLNAGETVSIIGRYDDDWLIINYEGQKAYISAQKHRVNFTATGQSKNSNSANKNIAKYIQVISQDGYVNFRTGPDRSNSIITTISSGTIIPIISTESKWYYCYYNNTYGYITTNPTMVRDLGGSSTATDYVVCDYEGDCDYLKKINSYLTQGNLTANEVKKCRALINSLRVDKHKKQSYIHLQYRTRYSSQRQNTNSKADAMCNLTTAAMCLEYLGIPNPCGSGEYADCLESIRVNNGFGDRTTEPGWGACIRECGAKILSMKRDIQQGKQWYVQNILPQMTSGRAVMLSYGGHIVRVVAMDDNYLYVDDPMGQSRLGKGGEYEFIAKNEKYTYDNKGENTQLTWESVSQHKMRWIAVISK